MNFLFSAVIVGLLGSFHCVGMCGPIALSIPVQSNSRISKIISAFLYNFSRALMYGIIGILFGLLGKGFSFIGIQKCISIIMGVIMVLSVLTPFIFKKLHIPLVAKLNSFIQVIFSKFIKESSYKSNIILGLANALLPCGLVYLAIAGSIETASAFYGFLYMFLFGIGTLPIMFTIVLIGNFAGTTLRNKINKAIPIFIFVFGLFFILRGLSLGIPFISPSTEKMNVAAQSNPSSNTTTDAVSKSCCHGKK